MKSCVTPYRFGFNGQEKDNEIYGESNSYTAEFWQYDPRTARRWNIDPAFKIKPWMSPYHAFSNKPIINIDPNGAVDGEYYDQNGNKLGNDGIDDKNVYIVTNSKEARDIKKTDKEGGTTPLSSIKSSITLPNKSVRTEMSKIDQMDTQDPYREYGGFFGLDKEGNEIFSWAHPSERGNPVTDTHIEFDPFNAQQSELKSTVDVILGTFHSHPSGKGQPPIDLSQNSNISATSTTYTFVQSPSATDVTNAQNRAASGLVTGNSYVIGTSNQTVYIYNGAGAVATFPLSQWATVGK